MDTFKAFDKVFHEGIMFKVKQNGISDDLLNILAEFLKNWKQRDMPNGQSSSWSSLMQEFPENLF